MPTSELTSGQIGSVGEMFWRRCNARSGSTGEACRTDRAISSWLHGMKSSPQSRKLPRCHFRGKGILVGVASHRVRQGVATTLKP